MFYRDVRTTDEALIYFAECQLSTVSSMAMKKSRKKYEYKRQLGIAQKMCDCIGGLVEKEYFDRNEKHIQNKDVLLGRVKVEEWAKGYES